MKVNTLPKSQYALEKSTCSQRVKMLSETRPPLILQVHQVMTLRGKVNILSKSQHALLLSLLCYSRAES